MNELDARNDSVFRWARLRAKADLRGVILTTIIVPAVGAWWGDGIAGLSLGLGTVALVAVVYTFLVAPVEQRNALRRELEAVEGKKVVATVSIPEGVAAYATQQAWSLYLDVLNEGAEGTFWASAQWIHNHAPMHLTWKVCWGGTPDKRHLIGPRDPNSLHLVKITRTHGGGLAQPIRSTHPLEGHQDKKDPIADEMGISLSLFRKGASDSLRIGLRFERHPTYLFQLVRDDSILPPDPAGEATIQ